MASIRNDLADSIVEILQDIRYPRPVLVTREPFEVEKLAITQFPAILVQTGAESRDTETMHTAGVRRGTIQYLLRGFVRGTELDKKRNELIEAIEEKLDADRYRGKETSVVQNSQIVSVDIVERLSPLAEFTMTYEITYYFTRGTA